MNAVAERPLTMPPAGHEETARAEHYAVIAHLFAAPPAAAFLGALPQLAAAWSTPPSPLGKAWEDLAKAAGQLTADQIEDEYTRLFLTIGRPEVMLFGSFYLAGFLMEEPLVDLRNDLAELGLGRRSSVTDSEDHFAALCEVMRHLIGNSRASAGLAQQRHFFGKHIAPWFECFCTALQDAPQAPFYSRAAALVREFLIIERMAFELL